MRTEKGYQRVEGSDPTYHYSMVPAVHYTEQLFCLRCGAMVWERHFDLHDTWHEGLEKR